MDVSKKKLFPDLTLNQVLRKAVREHPHAPAFIFKERCLNYAQLDERVERLAAQLSVLGVKQGDRVGIDLPNWPEFVETYFAIARLGAVIVPISTRLRHREVEYILKHSEVSLVVTAGLWDGFDYAGMFIQLRSKIPNFKHLICVGEIFSEYQSKVIAYRSLFSVNKESLPSIPHIELNPAEDVALVLYTSGTTGFSKGVMLTHRNVVWTAYNENSALAVIQQDRFLLVVPFFHVFGAVVGILCAVTTASSIVMLDTFKADDVLATVEKEKCTILYGTPTMFILELNSPHFSRFDLSSLRTGMVAAAPCPPEMIKEIMSRMHCNIAVSYGLTETSPALTITRFSDPLSSRLQTVGSALPGIELKVIDDSDKEVSPGEPGELVCRGYAVMKGYLKQPKETAEILNQEGWLRTGDMATLDEGGFVRIVGRKKDLIKRGGFAIFPTEVENYLCTHSMVQDVAIIGIPDRVLGERTRAYIILKKGVIAMEQQIIEFCKGKIADYKIPDEVRFTDILPMTASGKVRKMELRDMALQEMSGVS